MAPNFAAIAGNDITVNMDGNETVFGTMQAYMTSDKGSIEAPEELKK